MDVPREHTNRYGILDIERDDGRLASVRELVEKPDPADAPSTLSIIGRYILQPQVFEHLDKQEKGAGGEIQLTDAIAREIHDLWREAAAQRVPKATEGCRRCSCCS